MKQFVVASRVNFNPMKRMQRFKDWQSDCMARERGISTRIDRRVNGETKAQHRLMCESVIGPALKGETLAARGAYEKRKGGVVPSGSR